jgi:hypothetical protein
MSVESIIEMERYIQLGFKKRDIGELVLDGEFKVVQDMDSDSEMIAKNVTNPTPSILLELAKEMWSESPEGKREGVDWCLENLSIYGDVIMLVFGT